MKSLLEKVNLLNDKYHYISKITGETFNLFSLLNVEYDEVKTHSSFITELINPYGSHNQKSKFFDLFLEVVGIANVYDTDKPIVSKERYSKENGRIDIWVYDGKNVLIIENKIGAEDQEDQLERYFREAKKYADISNIMILYLTLDGSEPSANSLKNDETKENVILISYRNHILSWLKKCVKEVATITILREAIHQYLLLIKKITGQGLHEELKMDLINLLREGDNFEQAVLISNEIENVRKEIEKDFWLQLSDKINSAIKDNGMQLKYRNLKYSFDTKDTVFEKNKSKINHGCYGIYYEVKNDFLDDYDLIFGVEVEYSLYMGFSLVNNEGDAFDIDQFKDRIEIKELSETFRKIGFVVKYCETKNSRDKQFIGWKYLNDEDSRMSLFDIQQIARISNIEKLNSYTENLKNIVVDTIHQIGSIPN